MNTCTTSDCDTDSGELYLCSLCVSDLAQWIEKGRELLPEMDVTIARLDAVLPTNNEGNNGTKSAGSSAPLDLTALEVKMDMEVDLRFNAEDYAQDPWSAEEAPRVIKNIKAADLLVHGPNSDKPTELTLKEHREKLAKHCNEPLPPRQAREYLHEHLGVFVSEKDIKNWVQLRKLKYVFERVVTDVPPKRLYWPVNVLRVQQGLRGGGQRPKMG